MKKILFVVDERIMGGVSIMLEDVLNSVDFKNCEIDVLILHNNGDRLANIPNNVNVFYGTSYFGAIDYTIKDALKTKNIKTIFNKVRVVFDLKTGLIKRRIVKERKKLIKKEYDLEIAFKDAFPTLFTAYGDTKMKIGWLQVDYNNNNPTSKYHKLFVDCYSRMDKVIAVSKGVKEGFNKIFNLGERVTIINNLVNEKKILNIKNGSSIPKQHSGMRIVSVGRLHYHKGYDNLLVALDILNKQDMLRDVKIEIYGDGPEKDKLITMNSKFGLTDVVNFKGQTNNPYSEINGADLFVLPSISESFGLVIIESMLMGVPVLATKNAATDELINNDINGLIVENSVEGLCEGLEKLILNHNKIKEYKKALIGYRYDNKKIIKEIEQLISE